jgi:hypothetical protein
MALAVTDLLAKMKRTVRSYPPSMIEVNGGVSGTSFFPGGSGLVKNADATWPDWPQGKIMVVGNDWGTKAEYDGLVSHPSNEMKSSTWRGILNLFCTVLRERELTLQDCFFTNAYMGVRRIGSSTGECPGRSDKVFREQCTDFLRAQIAYQQPALIFTIGKWAPEVMAALAPCLREWGQQNPEWKFIDAHGPLHKGVVLDGLPDHASVVAALTHFDRPWLGYPNRTYGEFGDERGLISAALDAAFPAQT